MGYAFAYPIFCIWAKKNRRAHFTTGSSCKKEVY